MDNFKLFALGFNPNGTNDVIITDKDGKQLGFVEEAMFGYRVGPCGSAKPASILDHGWVQEIEYDRLEEDDDIVEEIDFNVIEHFASRSPVAGYEKTLYRIKEAMVEAMAERIKQLRGE